MFWRLFRKAHIRTPVQDSNMVVVVGPKRYYAHLWDCLKEFGWRIALHNLMLVLFYPRSQYEEDVYADQR